MIKQLLINGQVNRYTLSNRARQAIAFQYITDNKTLRLIDTYNNVAVDLVADGDNALTSSAMEKVWQYIQSRVDEKVGGAFKFRGTVSSLDEVTNPKAGDVYQIKITDAQYDPKTGQVIPSSLADNDKEYAWAEHEDGTGQWIELGFNYEGGAATEQWVKEFFYGKFQQGEIIDAVVRNTQLSTTLQTRDQAIEEHNELLNTISSTAQDLYNYIDQQAGSTEDIIDTVSTALLDYIQHTVSTSIVSYVNDKINETYNTLELVSSSINNKINFLSTSINNVHNYVDQQTNNLSATVNNKFINLSSTVDGKIVTLTNTFDTKLRTVSSSINNKIASVSTSFDHRINNLEEDLNDKIADLNDMVIARDSILSTNINNLQTLVNERDNALSAAIVDLNTDFNTKINNLNVYVIKKDNALSSAIDDLSNSVDDRFDELLNKHNTDMSFIQYDDYGNIITP